MRLNPPKKSTFWISLIFALLGILVYILGAAGLFSFSWMPLLGFLLVVVAYIIIFLGLLVKGF